MATGPGTFYDRVVKRAFDVAAASAALVVLSPLLAGVAVAVKRRHGSPVLFRQRRTGRHGEPFDIFKFRTMTDERDERGALLPDQARLTPLGKWLRSTSIDELPELWNVVRGDMSLVGPRPLLHHYMERYTEEQKRRHECRPGLTGWVGVNGRNTNSWAKRFAMDRYYREHLGPKIDAEILLRTVVAVVRRTGVDEVPEFMGEESAA